MNLHEGQTLYFVRRGGRGSAPGAVTVTKVGRKWAALDNGHRIDVQNLEVDGRGYNSPGRCYLSREAYESEAARDRAWSELRRLMPYRAPKGLDAERIHHYARLLGVEIEPAKADQ